MVRSCDAWYSWLPCYTCGTAAVPAAVSTTHSHHVHCNMRHHHCRLTSEKGPLYCPTTHVVPLLSWCCPYNTSCVLPLLQSRTPPLQAATQTLCLLLCPATHVVPLLSQSIRQQQLLPAPLKPTHLVHCNHGDHHSRLPVTQDQTEFLLPRPTTNVVPLLSQCCCPYNSHLYFAPTLCTAIMDTTTAGCRSKRMPTALFLPTPRATSRRASAAAAASTSPKLRLLPSSDTKQGAVGWVTTHAAKPAGMRGPWGWWFLGVRVVQRGCVQGGAQEKESGQ